jgi:signal transduction histidine kinase
MPSQDKGNDYALSQMEFWQKLFSPDGYMPRRICGQWTQGEIYLHNASDFFIWTAYLAIPLVLLFFWWRRKSELPFRSLFLLFGMFIIACGTTHMMEIVMFYYPVYRLAGVIKFMTAVVSWATVVALIPAIPLALAMQSPARLEEQVRERTAELELANQQKDELLVREQNARVEAEFARGEAETANRAKDEFLMILSHELRTPLNAIQGWSSLLLEHDLPEDVKIQAIETIERSTQIQTRLISDILEVSRIISGKLVIDSQPVGLTRVGHDALASVQPAATAKGLQVSVDIKDQDLIVMGDLTRIQQIIWNLLSNAVKFTPAGGQITLSIWREEKQAKIEVTDTGKGISSDLLPFVFDRFRQGDSSMTRQYGGLGLGLAIVRHLVELHGGSVTAESAGENQGAQFTLTLPLLEETEHQPTAPKAEFLEIDRPLEGLQVLIVDDEIENREIIATIIELNGGNLELASSAEEARQILKVSHPDILLCDIGMPIENGYEFLESLGDMRPKISLALTAYASSADKKRALQAGFDAHLAKPILPSALIEQITRLIRSKSQE